MNDSERIKERFNLRHSFILENVRNQEISEFIREEIKEEKRDSIDLVLKNAIENRFYNQIISIGEIIHIEELAESQLFGLTKLAEILFEDSELRNEIRGKPKRYAKLLYELQDGISNKSDSNYERYTKKMVSNPSLIKTHTELYQKQFIIPNMENIVKWKFYNDFLENPNSPDLFKKEYSKILQFCLDSLFKYNWR